MKHRNLWAAFVFLALGALVVGGCGKKSEESGDKDKKEKGKDKKAREGDKDKGGEAKGPVKKPGKPPKPAPLPKVDPKGVAASFPKFVPVGPPPKLAAELKKAEEALGSSSWKDKKKGRDILRKITDANKKNAHLARYLMSKKDSKMVRRGVRIYRKIKDNKNYVPVILSLFGSASDRVRADAISSLRWNLKKEQLMKAVPFARKLLKDESCIVRREALNFLTYKSRDIGSPKKEVLAALDDKCPAVKVEALEELKDVVDSKKVGKDLVKKITDMAVKSPFYHVRCEALQTLGELKVKEAEKLMAKALGMPAGTAVVVYYKEDNSPYTYNLAESSMPLCGASALSKLHGKKVKGERLERVRTWRKEMAKKRLAKKPPKKLCISKKQCEKGKEVCLEMACVPLAKAEKAYWKHELYKRCWKKPAKPAFKNFTKEPLVKAGLGLHWMADSTIRKFLRKDDAKAYKKKAEANKKKPCPRG